MSTNTPIPASINLRTGPRQDDGATPRIRLSLLIAFLGLLVFLVGAKPDWFGWDRSPVVGFVQISVFLFGLGMICLGGYLGIITLWWGHERTIMADIGARLVGTGYVFAVFAGMADIFGMGSHVLPMVPYFGPWQAAGVLIGQGIVVAGFLLLIPFHVWRGIKQRN